MAIGRKTTRRRRIRRPRRSRRRFHRRRRISRKPTTMRIPGTIVPDRMFTKFRYVDTVTLTGFSTPTENDSTLAFSYKDLLMSVSNPFVKYGTITDDTPAGLELWSQFYNEVAVTAVKVKVTPISWILNVSSPGPNPAGVGMPYSVCLTPVPTNLGNPSSATVDFLEQPYRRYKYFTQTQLYDQIATGGDFTYYSAQSGNSVERSVSNSMTSKKMLGYKDLFDYNDTNSGNFWLKTDGTDPTYTWYFMLTVKSAIPWDGLIPVNTVTFPDMVVRIEVDYSVAFRDRKVILEGD